MKQRGRFGQQCRAYAKAPIGMRLYGISAMRQNALNRFRTALYERCLPTSDLRRPCEGMHVDLSMKTGTRGSCPSLRLRAPSGRGRGQGFCLRRMRCSSLRTKTYHTLMQAGVGPYGVAAKAVTSAFAMKWPERKKSGATPSNISPRDERERAVSDSLLWQPRDSRLMHSRGRDLRNFSSLN